MIPYLHSSLICRTLLVPTLFFIACHFAAAQAPNVSRLEPGKAIEREMKGGEAHSYDVELLAGQFLNVVVEQKGLDVVVTLFDSGKKNLAEVDSPNGEQGPEPLSIIIEISGNYRLEVRSLEKTAPAGRYEAKIVELRTATEKDKSRIAAQKAYAEGWALQSQRTAKSLPGAVRKYEEALPLYRSVGDKGGEANTLNNIGFVYNALGENQQALKFFNDALPLRREAGDRYGEGATLQSIGAVYRGLGENQQALKYLSESLTLLRALGTKDGEASTLIQIGALYEDLGENQQALKYLNESLTLFRMLGLKEGESASLNLMGSIYHTLSENQQALKIYNEALTLRRAVGDKRGEAFVLHNIGMVTNDLGEKQQALKYLNESLVLIRGIGDRAGEASMLSNIGGVYSELGDKQQALKFLHESLPLLRAVGDKSGEANALANLFDTSQELPNSRYGVFYGKQSVNNYQALRSSVRGIDKNVQKTFLKSIEAIYRKLADALIKQQRFAEAQQILNLFKDQQYFDFNANKQTAPLALTARETALTADFDQKLEAVVSAIRGLDAFKRGIGQRAPTAAEAAEIKVRENRLQTARDDYQAFLRIAAEQFARPPDATDKAATTTDLQAIQAALRETSAAPKQNTVAVYTLVGDDNYRALVVTHDDIFAVSTPIKGEDLNKKALQLWSLLRTPKYDPQLSANEMYKLVFAPIEAKLPKGTKTILWSLDGNLRYIPISALHDGNRYLAERYESVIFTRSDKDRMTRAVSPEPVGTGLGSSEAHTVELAGEEFGASALPSVKRELGRIFKKENPNGILSGGVLLDRQFTRAAMLSELKERRPLVHIASHFRFEPGDEARSFLLLGDGSPFTLHEMKEQTDLFSGVDMLTLSACQTAAQRPDANGREVDGFAELAQRLGAGAVMASLWEVADDSTAELMARFYRGYRGGPTRSNKADALRRAQLALLRGTYRAASPEQRQLEREKSEQSAAVIKNAKLYRPTRLAPYAHPYYWSPFILIGNWK